MIELSKGQWMATEFFGLPPFWWGWIIAGIAVGLALAACFAPRPGVLAGRRGSTTLPRVDHTWLIVVILGALALHSYGFLGNFNLYDDFRQIHVEDHVNTLSWDNFWYLLTENHKGSNQELMYLSFMFNWALAGRDYWVWYLFNWLLLPPLLLCIHWITVRLTGDRLAGVIAAACFATSPITSELLCWMSVRSHLYGLVFTLLSLGAYLEYARDGARRRWGFYVLSAGAFLLSQFCKPIYIFVPVWLVLFDLFSGRLGVGLLLSRVLPASLRGSWTPPQHPQWYLAIPDKLPFVAIAIAAYVKIRYYGAGDALIRNRDPLGGSYLNTVLQDFNLLVEYGRTLFVPSHLGMAPPYNEATGWFFVEGIPMVLANGFAPLSSLLILLSVLAVAIAARLRGGDGLPLLWLFAAGVSMATVLNIPNRGHAATFEYRYTISANVITAVLLGDLFIRLARGRLASWASGRVAVMGLIAAYLTWCVSMTAANTHAWQVSHHLWVRNAEMYPYWYSARYYAGKSRQWNKENYMAVEHLLVAEQYNDRNDKALHKRLGDNAYAIERYDLAKEHWLVYFRRYPKKINDKYRAKFEKVGLIVTARGRLVDPMPEPEPAEETEGSDKAKEAEEVDRKKPPTPLRRPTPLKRPILAPRP